MQGAMRMNHIIDLLNVIRIILTPVNTVIASSALDPSVGYDSRHLCQIPLTLNFGKISAGSSPKPKDMKN